MRTISVADLQLMIPSLTQHVGEEYLIINKKTKQIVGRVQILEPPENYLETTKYQVEYKRKNTEHGKR